MHVQKLADLRKQRSAAFDKLDALAKKDVLTAEEEKQFDELDLEVKGFDASIKRTLRVQQIAAEDAQPVSGQSVTLPASAKSDMYESEKSLVVAGCAKMIGKGGGSVYTARTASIEIYGENHPVTKALQTNNGPSGGFIVPPDYMNEIIELLRPLAVVRGSMPRTIPMPRGTMTLPGQASAANASYGTEGNIIQSSQQTLNQIVASYKKLTALVPVSNDMMRYSDPAVDAFVRDDLVKVIGLREDLAFLLGDGTQATPRGYISFASGYASANGGTAALLSTTAASTAGVGGNFIASTLVYTAATVNNELTGAINKLDEVNVPDNRRVWFMRPRTYNFLNGLQNSLGVYVYREELSAGKLMGYPVKKTTQIPNNYWDPTATYKDCSLIVLAEMTESMIFDSMQMELTVSQDGSYINASGQTVSAFQNDQTLIRAIEEHDFQMRHDAAVAVIQFVRWAPSIS